MKLQLKVGEQNAIILCHHNSLVETVNAALGGGSDTPSGPPQPGKAGVKDMAAGYGSLDAAIAGINSQL